MDSKDNSTMQVAGAEAQAAVQQSGDQEVVKLLTEIRDMTKRDLILQRINSGAILCICIAFLFVVVNLIPKLMVTIDHINEVATVATNSMHEIDLMVTDMTEASANINKLVKDNAEPLSSAVTNMSNVDFDGLNKAIEDLQATVGPLASFFGRFQ